MEEWERILVDKLGPIDEQIGERSHSIPLSDGYIVQAKVWRPTANATAPRPVILLFHGGGFCAGSAEMCTRPGREFALEFDAVIISATYRLAPGYEFPQAARDGLDVLQWVAENAGKEFGASPEAGMIVGGYSAGGQVAAVVASEARFKGFAHPITGSFICISLLFMDETVPEKYKNIFTSRTENGGGPMGRESIQKVMSQTNADPTSPMFCPFHHSHGLKGLPRTYVQVGGKDCVRDDGIIYTKLVQDAGVETRFDNHEALGHESWTIFTDMAAPNSTELKGKTLDAMKWLLRR